VPTKAAYLDLEDDAEVAFEFYLAEKLHRTVAEIREMDNDEFMRWGVYFGRKAQQQELAQKQGR
jgi:hypothetical protein